MELTPNQVKKFIEIHSKYGDSSQYSNQELKRIATGVASYYLRLFKIYKEISEQKDPFVIEAFDQKDYYITMTLTSSIVV